MERAALERVVEGARTGSSGALLVSGEPGTGKTALLDDAARSRDGLALIQVRGIEAEATLPFVALADIVRPIRDRIDRLPEIQAASLKGALALGPPVPGDRFTIYAALLSLIALASEEQPILLLVDDLQWLDPGSAEALLFVSRRLSVERVAILFSTRPDVELPADPAGLPVLRLTGLDRHAGLELLAMHNPGIALPVAEELYRATAGNPLALREIPRLLSGRQLAGQDPLPTPLPVGARLVGAYAGRFKALPAPTRVGLLLAAASDEADLAVIKRAGLVAGFDPATAFGPAENAGLIQLNGRIDFCHPLIRSAVYEAATPQERRNAHRILAESLPSEQVARRAWHRAASAVGPGESFAKDLEAVAAEQTARRAYSAAFQALDRAAELSPRTEDRVRRLSGAAVNAMMAGRAQAAVAKLDQALGLATDPLVHADLALMKGQIVIWLRDPMGGHRTMIEEAARVEGIDARRAALLLLQASGPCFMAADIREAMRTTLRAREVARKAGDEGIIAAAELALGEAMVLHGEAGEGLPTVLRLLLPLSEASREVRDSVGVRNGAFLLVAAGELETARKLLDSEIEGQRSAGAPSFLQYPLAVLSDLEFRTGSWLSGYANASESLRLASETGQDNGRSYALSCVARFEAATGRDNECLSHTAEAKALAQRFGTRSVLCYALAIEGLLHAARERWQQALETLEQVHRLCRRQEVRHPAAIRYHPDLIEAQARLGDRDKAQLLIGELDQQLRTGGDPWSDLVARRARGMLEEGPQYEGWFEDSIALSQGTGDRFESARTELAFGSALRRRRRRADARQHLHAALEVFEDLGAQPWAQRTNKELAATGERVQEKALAVGRVLTPQELQVCLAVSAGRTNREAAGHLFLSLKTVETHLTNAYGKLGLRSRSELARLFASERVGAEMLSLSASGGSGRK